MITLETLQARLVTLRAEKDAALGKFTAAKEELDRLKGVTNLIAGQELECRQWIEELIKPKPKLSAVENH